MASIQSVHSPAAHHFTWTADWYEWDSKAAHKAALKARNAQAKMLKAQGFKVTTFSLPNQLRTVGGIGSGHPEISLMCNSYGLNAYRQE